MPTANEIAMLQAAREAGIASREELANFMAQISHESGGLTQLEESFRYTRGINQIPVQSAFREGREVLEAARLGALAGRPQELARLMYGGRMGNDDAGDGYLYRGRGFTQLTGEDNYRSAGASLNLDLVGNPDLAVDRDNAARIAVWYWQDRVPQANHDDVSAATRAINGGENGLADRHNRFDAWHAQLTPEFMIELAAGRVQPGIGVAPVVGREAMFDGVLRRGETGREVGELQGDLRTLGITSERNQPVVVNNSYGPGTEQAVRRFQEQQGLPVTGRAGPETLTSLQEATQLHQQPRMPGPRAHDDPHRDEHQHEPRRDAPGRVPDAQRGLPQPDPRDPDHPDHAMNQGVREQVRSLYAEQGVTLTDQQLDRTTASVMRDAKLSGMTEVTLMVFSEDPRTGQPKLDGNLIAYQGDPANPASRWSGTNTRQAAGTPEVDAYRQFEQATQQQTQIQAQYLAQQEQVAAQSRDRSGLSLG